jgi:hypothetical protein
MLVMLATREEQETLVQQVILETQVILVTLETLEQMDQIGVAVLLFQKVLALIIHFPSTAPLLVLHK